MSDPQQQQAIRTSEASDDSERTWAGSIDDDKAPLLVDEEAGEVTEHPVRRKAMLTIPRFVGYCALALSAVFFFCAVWKTCADRRAAPDVQSAPNSVEPLGGPPQVSRKHILGDHTRYVGSNRKWNVDEPQKTRHYDWEISEVLAAPGGIAKYLVVINGQSPGPIIEANMGDNIVVTVHNKLKSDSTSIHWHGMWQRGSNFMDGTMSINGCGIPPGKNATYKFQALNMGTLWYHSHRGMQYSDGLYGPIIIHYPNEPARVDNKYDDELLLMLGDLYNTRTIRLPLSTTGQRRADACPDGATINGWSQAKCAYLYPTDERPGLSWCGNDTTDSVFEATLVGGKTYRIRLVNHGTILPLTFSIDSHKFHVIETDGVSVEPYEAESLSLDVGHRYSILVTLDQEPGAYWMRTKLESHEMFFKGPHFNSTTYSVLRYEGFNDKPDRSIPGPDIPDGQADAGPQTQFKPRPGLMAPQSTVQHQIVYGVVFNDKGQNQGMGFNRKVWHPLPDGVAACYNINASNAHDTDLINAAVGNQFNIVSHKPTVHDLIFNAPGDTATHPFHLHGHTFWIMSQGTGPFDGDSTKLDRTNPMRRDTFVVPPGGHAVIRVLADNPGIWPLHCHVAWHLEGGLLMTFTSLPKEMIKEDIPHGTKHLCYKQFG